MAKQIKTRSKQSSLDNLQMSLLRQVEQIDNFQNSKLPTIEQVIGRIYAVIDGQNKPDFVDAISQVSVELFEHWKDRNVYPMTQKSVKRKIENIINGTTKHVGYRQLKSMAAQKRTQNAYRENCEKMNESMGKLLDIYCENKEQREDFQRTNELPPMLREDEQVRIFVWLL